MGPVCTRTDFHLISCRLPGNVLISFAAGAAVDVVEYNSNQYVELIFNSDCNIRFCITMKIPDIFILIYHFCCVFRQSTWKRCSLLKTLLSQSDQTFNTETKSLHNLISLPCFCAVFPRISLPCPAVKPYTPTREKNQVTSSFPRATSSSCDAK